MKKILSVVICITVMSVMSACGTDNTASPKDMGVGTTSVDSVMAEQIAKEDDNAVVSTDDVNAEGTQIYVGDDNQQQNSNVQDAEESLPMESMSHDGIDVDLTMLSSTMVYSEVYNMMVTPNDYVGKVIKMNGTFNSYHDENTDTTYYFCIIQDATACCAQGVEFILTDPSGYPQIGDNVTVVGTFSTYMEGEDMYCTLKDSQIVS